MQILFIIIVVGVMIVDMLVFCVCIECFSRRDNETSHEDQEGNGDLDDLARYRHHPVNFSVDAHKLKELPPEDGCDAGAQTPEPGRGTHFGHLTGVGEQV